MSIVFGDLVRCTFAGGRGGTYRQQKGNHDHCLYCGGTGFYSPWMERVFLVQNVRIRTTLYDGRVLKDVFDPQHEMDVRAKAIELLHEKLETTEIGESLVWDYQGYQFRTTVVERRDPPKIGVPSSEATY